MFKVHVWWDGFNGEHPNRIHFFIDREAAINYVDLCYVMGWDWALFTEDITDSTRFVIENKSF